MGENATSFRVHVEHEHHIPIAFQRICRVLAGKLSEAREQKDFEHFWRILHAIYHFEYHTVSQQLKHDFAALSAEARQSTESEGSLNAAEMRFLGNFLHVMQAGNFRLLTQQDVDLAEQENYAFTLPIRIDWDKLDRQLMSRFIQQHMSPEQARQMPSFAEQILVYKRGVGVDEVRGFLTLQKIDVLIDEIFIRLAGIVRKVLRIRQQPPARNQQRQDLEPDGGVVLSPTADESPANSPAAAGASPLDPLAFRRRERDKRDKIHDDRYVNRVTLRDTMSGPGWLFRRTTLREPTFKEIIILFRNGTPATNRDQPAPPKDREIVIKAFRDIPMADLEVVFPDKKISMKPLDLLKLIVTGTIGLVVVVVKLLAASALNPFLALAALFTMGGYAAKVLLGFKNSRDRYQHLVTDSLYHKNLDNDLGVIFYLIDSLEEQEVKEAVLGYYFLWHDGPQTEKELDRRCEQILLEQFDLQVDFEIEDALQKLIAEGLAWQEGDHYHARPLRQALETLDRKWDEYFRFNCG